MVKGTKRKLDMKKITDKKSKARSFTKRSYGLYSKASQLCIASDAQIAILSTPSSSNSNVSFFSFGHTSVEAVVSAYLSGERLAPVSIMDSKEMREDLGVCFESNGLGLENWWDDEKRFKNPQQALEAMESMKSLLRDVSALCSGSDQKPNKKRKREAFMDDDHSNKKKKKKIKSEVVLDHHVTDETLVNFSDVAEHDQIMSISDSLCKNNDSSTGVCNEWSVVDFDQLLNGLPENLDNKAAEEDQVVSISENTCSDNKDSSSGDLAEEWSDTDLDQLLNASDDHILENPNEFVVVTKAEEEDQAVSISEKTCSKDNDLLPVKGFVDNNTEEEDNQVVSISEQTCKNDYVLLLRAGDLEDLDFESILEGLRSDDEFDEF